MNSSKLTTDETNDILKVVTDYTYALDVDEKDMMIKVVVSLINTRN